MLRPIHIEFKGVIGGILCHIVEKGTVFIRAEFISVSVIGQGQSVLFQLLSRLVEHLGSMFRLFEIPFVIVVWHPSTHDVFRPKDLALSITFWTSFSKSSKSAPTLTTSRLFFFKSASNSFMGRSYVRPPSIFEMPQSLMSSNVPGTSSLN